MRFHRISGHLGDAVLQAAAAQVAAVIARAMNYQAEPSPLPNNADTYVSRWADP